MANTTKRIEINLGTIWERCSWSLQQHQKESGIRQVESNGVGGEEEEKLLFFEQEAFSTTGASVFGRVLSPSVVESPY